MKRSLYFWAFLTIIFFILLQIGLTAALYKNGYEYGGIIFTIQKTVHASLVFAGIFYLFARNTPVSKGIVLGCLSIGLVVYSISDGFEFSLEQFADRSDKFTYIVNLLIIPISLFIASMVFYTKRNFEYAKAFIFLTTLCFAVFWLAVGIKGAFIGESSGVFGN